MLFRSEVPLPHFFGSGIVVSIPKKKWEPITGDDLEKAAGKVVRPRDVVLVNTGWGSLWLKDNAKFGASAPGPGLAVGQYLVEREIVMIGTDTWSMEVVPNPNPDLQFPVHQLLLARNGIYIFENLATEDLARDRAYEFAFFFAPLKLKGATGSPGNPIAIR